VGLQLGSTSMTKNYLTTFLKNIITKVEEDLMIVLAKTLKVTIKQVMMKMILNLNQVKIVKLIEGVIEETIEEREIIVEVVEEEINILDNSNQFMGYHFWKGVVLKQILFKDLEEILSVI
jgi:hypothetical protein